MNMNFPDGEVPYTSPNLIKMTYVDILFVNFLYATSFMKDQEE